MPEQKESKKKQDSFNINIEEMAKAGLHFGHTTSKRHPNMTPFLAGTKNTIYLIDLEKTAQKLREALNFVKDLISDNKILLFVGTKIQIKDLIKEVAIECGVPYVSERWLGGTFTNFETISKRIEDFKNLEKMKAEGKFENYTKKEKIQIDEKLKKSEEKFGGLKNLQSLPDAIFVADIKKDEIAVREAKKKNIKTIGIAHTDADPTLVDFPIPANDDSISSVKYILEKVKEVILNTESKKPSESET
jgi:small subunit ribosomal protein S2